nr:RNA-directed DNA polymerase, eukaryota [Tanacetum cinerariifolium]
GCFFCWVSIIIGDRCSFKSKDDLTLRISNSVFVTNFPDHFSARDLWNVCTAYGKVVDVYIPLNKSKAGKKFAFVRFLKGKIKDINALSNLYVILANEGFNNVNLTYLGGLWVLINAGSLSSKEKMIKHLGWLLGSLNSFLLVTLLNYVVTKPYTIVNDKIIIIVKGKIYWIRVKELEAWTLEFNSEFSDNDSSDEEFIDGEANDFDKDKKIDHVSESSCMNDNDELENHGLFKGIYIVDSLTLSHFFYAADDVFISKWDKSNLITIVHVLKCFFLASGLKINIHNSKLMGIDVPQDEVNTAANLIGCTKFTTPFSYLGDKVGTSSSRSRSWEEVLSLVILYGIISFKNLELCPLK